MSSSGLHSSGAVSPLSRTPTGSPRSTVSGVGEVKYFLKFAINVPSDDLTRMLSSGSRLLYPLRDCSRAGRAAWKLKLYRSQPQQGDASVAVYLKFEPQTTTEQVFCNTEFVIRITGESGKIIERQSSSVREFTREDDCWGWSQFASSAEVSECVTDVGGRPYLRFSGVIRIFDASQLLYPNRRHNFARSQNGADFRLKAGLATFHVHKAVLALNSDYFARLFGHECVETKSGLIVMKDEKIQDVHLMLQFMYPGYTDVLDESTLPTMARLASKYFIHTLAWECLHFIDRKLRESVSPETCMKYYVISSKQLLCDELAEQCIRNASHLVWSKIKATDYFKDLEETEKSEFLQKYLDYREMNSNNGLRTPRPTPKPILAKAEK